MPHSFHEVDGRRNTAYSDSTLVVELDELRPVSKSSSVKSTLTGGQVRLRQVGKGDGDGSQSFDEVRAFHFIYGYSV